MIKPKQVNHLVRALAQEGFYNGGANPGKVNLSVQLAISKFLNCSKGKSVRVVINRFKSVAPITFSAIEKNCDYISPQVRNAASEFLKKNSLGTISDIDQMQSWETGGATSFAQP